MPHVFIAPGADLTPAGPVWCDDAADLGSGRRLAMPAPVHRTPRAVLTEFGDPGPPPAAPPFWQRLMCTALWPDQPEPAPPALARYDGALVIGGRITRKRRDRHFDGQLLLGADGRLTLDSESLVDGNLAQSGVHVAPDALVATGFAEEAEDLPGRSYLLGSVPRHFGHFLLEGLSRVWGYHAAARIAPIDHVLIYEPQAPIFVRHVLKAAGIPMERVRFLQAPVVPETLYVGTPSQRTHRWHAAQQAETWARAARGVGGETGDAPRVFLTRGTSDRRPMVDQAALERRFAAAGFRVVDPTALGIRDQIRLMRGARDVAGVVGSQLYLAAFRERPGRTLSVAPSNFYLPDDALVAQGMGAEAGVVYGGAIDHDLPPAERRWTCDMRDVEAALDWLGPA